MTLGFPFLWQEAAVFGALLGRIVGILASAPLAWAHLPAKGKVALALLLAMVLYGPQNGQLSALHEPMALGWLLSTEFILGVTLGMTARLVFAVAEMAGDAIAPMMGLSAGQMFDPAMGAQTTVLSRILHYVCGWVLLSISAHHLLLLALMESLRTVPIGSLVAPSVYAPLLTSMVSDTLVAGVKLGLPIVSVLFITQVSLAFVARAAPAMQIFSFGFAVSLGVGTVLWFCFAPELIFELAAHGANMETNLVRLLQEAAQAIP